MASLSLSATVQTGCCCWTVRMYFYMLVMLWSRPSGYYTSPVRGLHQVIGSSQPVLARLGGNVILPCRVDPPVNMERSSVFWTRDDPEPPDVYALQDGRPVTTAVHPSYKRRTFLSLEELQHGDISLRLTGVRLSDQGTYRCLVPYLGSTTIQLLVDGVQQANGSSQRVLARLTGEVILPCGVDSPLDLEHRSVFWTRADLVPPYICALQDGRTRSERMHPAYRQRASLIHDKLSRGDIQMRLTAVGFSDQGTYRCEVPRVGSSTVQLLVDQEVTYLPPGGRGVRVELEPDTLSVPDPVTYIMWTHAPDVTAPDHANIAAEWEPEGLDYYRTFKNRTTLDSHTGRLVMDNMTVEDMGLYSVEFNHRPHHKVYVLKEMKTVPHPELNIVPPCDSNSSSCTLQCLVFGDVTESGVVVYRWRFHGEKWTRPKPNETRTYNDEEWTGTDSWEATISNDEEGRKVKRISCAIKNWISVEQSEAVDNPLYRAPKEPTGRLRHGIIVTVFMYAVALVTLIWNKNPTLTGEHEARRERERKRAAKLRGLLERTPGFRHITDYEQQLQRNMNSSYLSVNLGTQTEAVFRNVFTSLYNVDIERTDIHSHHEVRQMEMKKAGQGKEIQLGQMFKDLSGLIMRTVLTVGCAGIGKTFLVHKFMSDWAKKCFPQEDDVEREREDLHLVFPLKFRQLNLLKGQKFTLAQLIHHCIVVETSFIEEDILNLIFSELQTAGDYSNSPFKVMFVLDGYDENKFKFNFSTEIGLMNVNDSYPIEDLLVNLIKGKLLPSARIWITSRPVAANQIPKEFVNRMTEVRGFIRDDQKKEFFMKFFISDETQARSIYSYIKESKLLLTMCEIPVFCWILATVVKNMGTTVRLPKTLVELFCHYLMGEIQRVNPSLGGADREKLIKDAGKVLLKLSKLAFHQLNKGNIIFYEGDLKACGLDVKRDLKNLGFCTTFFKEDGLFFHKTVYCFVHLSIQEFLAAVYLFHCFTQRNKRLMFTKRNENIEVLKAFLEGHCFNSDSSLSDFLKAATKKTLKSESGHLDLFVRFLHGLSLQSNQSLLGGLLGQTENSPEEIQRVINNLKKMNDPDASPDRCINIFHCLMEMKDPSVSRGIQQYLESENSSGKELTVPQCSALVSMLQMSEEVLEEFNLQKYNTSKEGQRRLIPAVKNYKTARLVGCDLGEEHIEVVASALGSNPSHLTELDLSGNVLKDSGLDLICAALKSPNCCLETLRLENCFLTERCCEVLASALTSNPSVHLRYLDLSLNMVNESGMKMLRSAGLENLKVKHGGEDRFNPHLIKGHFQRLSLDTNTAHRDLTLSEDNRKVTWVKGQRHQYPDHPERFDVYRQVLSAESVSERCYSEVECSGDVTIAGTDRAISRKGPGDCLLGGNVMSWGLECDGDRYSVSHNGKVTVLPVGPSGSSNRAAEDADREVSEVRVCRVAVYVDRPAGTLSFYDVSSEDTLTHLYTFQNPSTEPLCVGFWLRTWGSSVFLCEQR